jgi:phage terminase small subunit
MADQPYQSAEILPYGTDRRLRPPDSLPDAARRAFVEVVSSHTAGHFKPGDLTVLCRYCELVALAEQAAFELARDGVVLADGKPSPWFSVHASTTKQIGVLAARLKISPSTRERRQSKKEAAPVSFYDRMRMQKDWDTP